MSAGTPPDEFSPAVFTLSDQPVQAVETSATDPKVRMDQTGFYVTDATGRKIAQLSDGLELATSDNDTPPNTRKLRFVRQGGKVGGQIFDWYTETLLASDIRIDALDDNEAVRSTLSASADATTGAVRLNTFHGDGSLGPSIEVLADDAGLDTIFIDPGGILSSENGVSDFLKLAIRQDLKVNVGNNSNGSINAGTALGNQSIVGHGLGRTPIAVIMQYETGGPFGFLVSTLVINKTASTFTWVPFYTDNVAHGANPIVCSWVAIG